MLPERTRPASSCAASWVTERQAADRGSRGTSPDCRVSPRYALRTSSLAASAAAVSARMRPARLQHVPAGGDLERLLGILLDQQDGRPLRVDLPDDGEESAG